MSVVSQIPLRLGHPPDQRLENFVAAPETVLAQLRALAAGQGQSLYLAGPAGAGKSHLALALCAEAKTQGRAAHYLPLAACRGRLPLALPEVQAGGLYVLDALEHIVGEVAAEVALFNFHNAAQDVGAGLLYAARELPDALGLHLPDLRSRLNQLVRINLPRVDDAARAEILRLRAERRGLQLDAAAIDWLLKNCGRDLQGLTALLDRLDHESLAAQRRVSVPFLRKVLQSEAGEGRV